MVIGEAKCGTSSFHQLLSNSGHFRQSQHKELHYFDRACPLSWNYQPEFKPSTEEYWKIIQRVSNNDQLNYYSLDSTPSYFRTPGLINLIKQHAPIKRKYILLLRNPVTRLYSNYWMLKRRKARKLLNFTSFIDHFISREETAKVSMGISFDYAHNLKRWKTALGSLNDLKIIFYEELFRTPKPVLTEVSSFLSINITAPNTLPCIIPDQAPGTTPNCHYPPIKAKHAQRLREYFFSSNYELSALLEQDLPWTN